MELQWDTIDPLGEALHHLRMGGIFYSRSECSAPWGLDIPPMRGCLTFHVVTAGQCWLEVAGEERQLLRPGVFALVPHGEGHLMVSEPGATAAPLFDLSREFLGERYEIIRHGGGGAPTTLICGAVRFDHPAAYQFLRLLPRLISIEEWGSPEQDWFSSTLRFIAAEARVMRPGGEAIITRLADIMVIQAIRSWIARDPAAQQGWLGALQDRQIGRAIAFIHRDATRTWTVATLADEVAMSRSAFAARFTALVGEPPMQYLARWRMHVALTWLKEDDSSLGEIAHRLGYQSEAAFSRAFKRFIGVSPGAARRSDNLPYHPAPTRLEDLLPVGA